MKPILAFAIAVTAIALVVVFRPIAEQSAADRHLFNTKRLEQQDDNHQYKMTVLDQVKPTVIVSLNIIIVMAALTLVGLGVHLVRLAGAGVTRAQLAARTLYANGRGQMPLIVDNVRHPRYTLDTGTGAIYRLSDGRCMQPANNKMISAAGYVNAIVAARGSEGRQQAMMLEVGDNN